MTSDDVTLDDPLRQLFSGKRRHPRRDARLLVDVGSSTGRLPGKTLDISRGGALLRFDVSDVAPGGGVAAVVMAVEKALGKGFLVAFRDKAFEVGARIVRLEPPDPRGRILVGCQFERDLSVEELDRLAPAPERKPGEVTPDALPAMLRRRTAPPEKALALRPRAASRLRLLLFPHGLEAGPRWIGLVKAIEGGSADVVLGSSGRAADGEVEAALSRGPIEARLLVGGVVAWRGRLEAIATWPAGARDGGTEVRLTGRTWFGGDVERACRRAS